MTPRTHRWLSALMFAGLILAHLDVWRTERDQLWFGWLPEELLWRLLWMAGAMLFIVHFASRVWRDEPDAPTAGGSGSS